MERLQPGFEAPVCIVGSIGHTLKTPSRNRTVLVGLIRDMENPLATRFEVRSPNPHSNTYLTIAALYQSALDGIRAAVESKLSTDELERAFNKKKGESAFYLETDREYRSELDVFEEYTPEERNTRFGHHPATVWENLEGFSQYPDKADTLKAGGVFTDAILHSYRNGSLTKWSTELSSIIIPRIAKTARAMVRVHDDANGNTLDEARWADIEERKHRLLRDEDGFDSLTTRLRCALDEEDLEAASQLQQTIKEEFSSLKSLYTRYKRNII